MYRLCKMRKEVALARKWPLNLRAFGAAYQLNMQSNKQQSCSKAKEESIWKAETKRQKLDSLLTQLDGPIERATLCPVPLGYSS